MNTRLSNRLASEGLGTFCLVFAGTGAIVINDLSGGLITHTGIAITFGLVVLAMIYALGDISGAHINPAVTLGFYFGGRLEGRLVVPYIISQCSGAVLASVLVRVLFPAHGPWGATMPSGSVLQSFALEVVLAFILMFVILSVSTGAKEKGVTAGIAVGSVVGLEALFAGPISGASMNPARSLGPAVASLNLQFLWIYIAAPVAGALLAVPVCRMVRGAGCCAQNLPEPG